MERIKAAIEKARSQAGGTRLAPEPGTLAPMSPPVQAQAAPARVEALDPDHLAEKRIVAFERGNPARWVFDLLRTQVLQKMNENGWKTLAVTSPTLEAGKTVTAINLAMSIAHHPQHSATLVDFDLRRPRVGAYLGLTPAPSVPEILAGQAGVNGCLVDVGLPRLRVLPSHRPVQGASEALASEKALELIERLKAADPAGIVVFDLPPVTAVDDVIAVLPRMDCALLVIGNGMSTQREIQEAQRHLGRANVIGYVLNKATVPVRNPGYY